MGREETIFFADNDPQSSSEFCMALERTGYRVERCPLDDLPCALNGTLQGIVVMNLGNNVQAGLEVQQQLIADGFAWPVIFISDCDQIPEAVKAMKRGAVNFHVTSEPPGNFLQSVHEAMLQLDAEIDLQLQRAGIEQRFASLTRREREIMKNITDGQTNRDIANQLGLSQRTIEVHRLHVMKKMGATCLADLTRMADLCMCAMPVSNPQSSACYATT